MSDTQTRLDEIAELNPTRALKKGKMTSFVEMASLPTNSRDIENIAQKEFSGSGSKFKNGDILFARITPCLENGKTAKVAGLQHDEIAHGSTEFIVLSAREPEFDEDYLYYFCRLSEFRNYAKSRMEGTSGRQRVSWQALAEFEFDFPDKEIRKKAADMLKIFDDKIQLNTQTNQTLEAIAQAIFKSWFVDFDPVRAKVAALSEGKSEREANLSAMAVISGKAIEDLSQTEYKALWEIADAFPSEFGDEGLPIGWKFNQADNLFEVGIGKTPPRKETEWFSDNANDMEWISIKDMGNQGMFITESGEYLKAEAVDKFNIKKIPKNTVILSFKLTVGRVSITTKETTTNEAIAHFKIPSPSKLSSEFLYCYLKNFDFNNLGSTSSIATAVNSKMIKEMEILEPSDLVVKHFNEYIEGIFNKLRENIIQNNNLAKIRDELLPKLLSGEIDCVQF